MKYMTLDQQSADVSDFFESLPAETIVLTTKTAKQFTIKAGNDDEREKTMARLRELMSQAEARNVGANDEETEQLVNDAVWEVRRRAAGQ